MGVAAAGDGAVGVKASRCCDRMAKSRFFEFVSATLARNDPEEEVYSFGACEGCGGLL
jgi:hypothetical protein